MAWKPERPIEIVAGTPPGGGLDRSARALQNAIIANGLLDVPVRVVNVGGEGGRKAWAMSKASPVMVTSSGSVRPICWRTT
jgi:putative tricarboxylic transport membrane protein